MTRYQIERIAKANIEKIAGIKIATCTACEDGYSIDFPSNVEALAKIRKAFKVIDYCEDEFGYMYCGLAF